MVLLVAGSSSSRQRLPGRHSVCLPPSSMRTRTIVSTVIRKRLGLTSRSSPQDRGECEDVDKRSVDQLCQLCEEFESKSSEVFPRLQAQIDTSSLTTAEQTYRDIADEIFRDGAQWGRIVALVAFTGFVAERMREEEDKSDLIPSFVEWLEDVLAVEHQAWITEHGGWDGFCQHFDARSSSGMKAIIAFAGFAVFLGAIATFL